MGKPRRAQVSKRERIWMRYGWLAVCACGWRKKVRHTREGARDDFMAHRYGCKAW